MSRFIGFAPAAIDALKKGSLLDPSTPGLRIEVLGSGKKKWKYLRRVVGSDQVVKATLGQFPATTIAEARELARDLNDKVEAGGNPREEKRLADLRDSMTVARAHEIYIEAAREGRASRAKRVNSPRTISDKLKIFTCDIEPTLGKRSIYDVTENDLLKLVNKKGKTAKVRANRLASELKVFFGWASSLRGLEIGLEENPARRLADLRFPEPPRSRKLSTEEIGWYLRAVAEEEERDFRRGLILLLLTAVRISELRNARNCEIIDGVWTIPTDRSKNSRAHSIALGPWGRRLMATNEEWIFPAPRVAGPRTQGWYEARDRVLARMAQYAGRSVEHFVPHDLRRTMRSNTKRLKIDFETAEAMLNHLKSGMARIYDGYEHTEEMAASFLRWENELAGIARASGVAGSPGVSPLRQRLLDDMALRRFGLETQRNYLRDVGRFATWLQRSPHTATAEDIRQFQFEQLEAGVPAPTMNSIVSALRFLFTHTLDRPDLARKLIRTRQVRKIPVVLTMAEVKRLLDATRSLKHQAALSVAYGAGLRVAEVAALKVSDVDSKRMLLRIEHGKGGRYRNAMLPEGLLLLLRDWWRAGRQQGILRPDGWLFPGQGTATHISTRQLYRVVVEAAEAADIAKRVGPHTLRHSFATHLLEDGVDIRVIQVLLGHAKINTTAFYAQVATKTMRAVVSPLDRLALAAPDEEAPDG